MFKIIDRTGDIKGKYDKRSYNAVDYIMIHRVGWATPEEWEKRGYAMDAIGVAAFYKEVLGWQMPYTFTICLFGVIEQAVKLSCKTDHAYKHNGDAIGIGVLGDFNIAEPTQSQIDSLTDLVALLSRLWPDARIAGHTDVPGATKDLNKICPGRHLNIADLNEGAAAINEYHASMALERHGVIF